MEDNGIVEIFVYDYKRDIIIIMLSLYLIIILYKVHLLYYYNILPLTLLFIIIIIKQLGTFKHYLCTNKRINKKMEK